MKTRNVIDKMGQKFNMLLVISRDGHIGRYSAWKCRCDCGVELTVSAADLTDDGKLSCGCKKRPYSRRNVASRDLIESMSIPEPNSGCWLWLGSSTPTPIGDYGRISISNTMWMAHRLSYFVYKDDPAELFVCHRCDNPICVNPDHLFLGTHQDNMDDMYAKRRHSHGSGRPASVLNEALVQEILADSRSCEAVAEQYGVNFSVISRIRRGQAWKHVPR